MRFRRRRFGRRRFVSRRRGRAGGRRRRLQRIGYRM